MARSAVTIASPSRNSSATTITKDAFDIANGHSIDISSVQDEDLTIFIETSDTTAATFTVNAGNGILSNQGDLTATTGAAQTIALDLESARFKDADGLITIDINSTGGATGNIYAVKKY